MKRNTDHNAAPRLLRVSEVAQLLGLHRATVWRMSRRGLLPQPVMLGAEPRYLAAEIEAAIAALPRTLVGRAPQGKGRDSEPIP